MTLRFAHAMIQVRDIDAAIAFYERALELRVVDRHAYDGTVLVYMRCGDQAFELELLSESPWAFQGKPENGRTHIAFTVDDLEAERERLVALGISVDQITDYYANDRLQTRYFYFCDPEGNQIEILEAMGRYAHET